MGPLLCCQQAKTPNGGWGRTDRQTDPQIKHLTPTQAHKRRVKMRGFLLTLQILFPSYITDVKEGQKNYEGGNCAFDQTNSQQSATNPQPVLDLTVPVSRRMLEVEITCLLLTLHADQVNR